MWMIPPELLCRQHLLGEHSELHLLAWCLERGHSIAGYLAKKELAPQKMIRRHNALAREILRRGWRHRSPLPKVKVRSSQFGRIDLRRNIADLGDRCEECRKKLGWLYHQAAL
jgi:hypothetical protein